MGRITYLPTIIKVTQRLCQVIVLATPVLRRLYPDNTALHNALETANTACALLNAEALKERSFGD